MCRVQAIYSSRPNVQSTFPYLTSQHRERQVRPVVSPGLTACVLQQWRESGWAGTGTSAAEHGRCLTKSATRTERVVVRTNDAESVALLISLRPTVAMTSRLLLLNPHQLRTTRKRSTSSPYLCFSKINNNIHAMTNNQTGEPPEKHKAHWPPKTPKWRR